MDDEIRKLHERISRLRFAILKLDEGYSGEYGHDGGTPKEIEEDEWLELRSGDMTGDEP